MRTSASPMQQSFHPRSSLAKSPYLATLALALLGLPLLAQTSPAPAQTSNTTDQLPTFEVATIRPVDPSKTIMNAGIDIKPGGRVIITGLPLKSLIHAAFHIEYWQISGGDDWVGKAEYNIEAVPSESFRATEPDTRHTWYEIEDEHLRQMLQALLIDRFQLRVHRESKTGKVYLLERSGKSLALHASPPPLSPSNMGWAELWNLSNITMPQLAHYASAYYLHAPVLDRTDLIGSFDYRSPRDEPDANGGEAPGSFLTMIHDVGLKLEPSKGPVETLVIDHAEKPSAN